VSSSNRRGSGLTLLKLGGELLEDAAAIRAMAEGVSALASQGPLVVIHGGGRAIDAELRARGLEPKFVDGLRVTDANALDVAVSVLAGRNNTAFVAALCSSGCRAVGLTGADAGVGLSVRAPVFTSTTGEPVDLGLVGQLAHGSTTLIDDLVRLGYVPVIASIGMTAEGGLLNINADTLAGHFAGALGARRLIIAGGTTGVLDAGGNAIAELTIDRVNDMIASGQAHSGMVAKLAACRDALNHGVADVSIVHGRDVGQFDTTSGTRIAAELTV
jgi:acetylglutamate kinase